MKDLASKLHVVNSIAHAQYTADKTDGTGYPLAGYYSISVVVDVSAVATADASNYFEVKIYESTDGGSTYAATDSSNYITSYGWDRLVNATTETGAQAFGWVNDDATVTHVKVVFDETGTADFTAGAVIIKEHPYDAPTG